MSDVDGAPGARPKYFLSSRMGCAKLHPIYGLDLTALCIRKSG